MKDKPLRHSQAQNATCNSPPVVVRIYVSKKVKKMLRMASGAHFPASALNDETRHLSLKLFYQRLFSPIV